MFPLSTVASRTRLFWTVKKQNSTTTTQPFNGLFSRTTWVSRNRKGKTNLDFTGARDSEWQWHQLGDMQITMPVPHHSVFYRPDALPVAQPTASKHWRLKKQNSNTQLSSLMEWQFLYFYNFHLLATSPGKRALETVRPWASSSPPVSRSDLRSTSRPDCQTHQRGNMDLLTLMAYNDSTMVPKSL